MPGAENFVHQMVFELAPSLEGLLNAERMMNDVSCESTIRDLTVFLSHITIDVVVFGLAATGDPNSPFMLQQTIEASRVMFNSGFLTGLEGSFPPSL